MSKTIASTMEGLAAAKRARDLSDQKIADALGMKRSTLNAKLRRRNPLTIDDLAHLCEVLQVPVEVVVLGEAAVYRWLADHPDPTIHLAYNVLLTQTVLDFDEQPDRVLVGASA